MWKRIGIILLALFSTCSIVYAMDQDLYAAGIGSADPQYLPEGTSFKMGDLTWKVADNNQDGTGIIVSHTYGAVGYTKAKENLPLYYDYDGQSDFIGDKIKEKNNVASVSLLKVSEYKMLSENLTNFERIDKLVDTARSKAFWIDDEGAYSSGYFYYKASSYSPYTAAMKNLWKGAGLAKVPGFPVFIINLPIQAIQTPTFISAVEDSNLTYDDVMTQEDQPFGVVMAVGGEGPFTFTIESGTSIEGDTTSDGEAIPAGTSFSSDFKLMQSNNREFALFTKNKLDAGDHYVKIKVVDTSTNTNIAYDVTDPKHTEKTIILKFHVDKKEQTIGHSSLNPIYLKIGDAPVSHTLANSNNTDAEFIAGKVSYTHTVGTPNTGFTITPSTTDPLAYDISVGNTYTGSGLPATFRIKATAAATKNFNEVSTVDDRDVIVYKALSDLAWVCDMPSGFTTSDVDTAGDHVGTLDAVDGIGPFTYELTTSADGSNYDSSAAANNGDFEIIGSPKNGSVDVVAKSGLPENTYYLQFKVTDFGPTPVTIYKSVQIKVSAQAQAALHFKTGANGTILDAIGKDIYIGATGETLFAEGGTTGNTITYDLVNPSDRTYLDVGGSGALTPNKVGTVRVKATMAGNTQYGDVSVEMEVRIKAGKQSIAFSDPADKNVMVDSAAFANPAVASKTSDGTAGVGTITYSSSHPNVASVNPSTGEITPGSVAGTTTITATIHDANGNYENASCSKKITTFAGMNTTWTPAAPNTKAGAIIANTTKAGKLSVTGNNGNPTFTIDAAIGDGSKFILETVGTSTTVKWNTTISASELVTHGATYTLRIKIEDNNHAPQYEDITITVDPADNAIDFMDGVNTITSITKTYGEDTSFSLQAVSKNGGTITYSIDTGSAMDVVSLSGIGNDTATIQKVGTTTIKASVTAGSGYAASDATIPVTIQKGKQEITFDDTTANIVFVSGGTFSASATLYETSAKTVSARVLQYSPDTPSICSVDAAGTVTMLAEGNCTIRAENSDANFESASKTRTINLYTGMGTSFTQTHTPQAETPSGKRTSAVGELHVNGGNGSYSYALGTGNDPANADISFFQISSTGIISLDKDINASDIASKYDATKQAYVLHAQFVVRDGLGNTKVVSADIDIKGAPLHASIDTEGTGKITHVYAPSPSNTFSVNMASNAGGGVPVYSFKSGPTDVLSIDASGRISILNASIAGDPLVEIQAVIPPSNGYDEEIVSCEVEITKAEQSDFKFQKKTIQMQTNSSLDPVITGIMSKQADGTLNDYTLSTKNAGIVSVNGTTIATNSTETPSPGIEIQAMVAGDRNYKSAVASAFVIVSDEPAYNFVISVPSAMYGDSGVVATIPIDDGTGVKTRTWTSSDPSVATVDNQGNITILKAGSTTITCEQSTPTQPTVRDSGVLVVSKKPITMSVEDKTMYAGEAIPTFTSTITSGSLVGNDPIPQITISCNKQGVPITSQSDAGEYPIEGTVDATQYPNYAITIVNGVLHILQDTSTSSWYHLEEHTTSTIIADPTKWYQEDIDIVLDGATIDARVYDEISLDKALWDTARLTETREGEINETIYFRTSTSHAISTPSQISLRIDKTKPIIKEITGEPANRNAIEEILHTLTFGKFFKPELTVRVQAEDVLPEGVHENSGLKEISYTVYEILANGTLSNTPITEGTLAPAETFQLADQGMYMVCAVAHDHAGNTSSEKCSGVRIYTRGEDTNNDGIPDINIDIDGDGIPDINITEDGKKIPHTNIDTDGDGIPDYNIDIDNDGTPDMNIGPDISGWNPKLCIDIDADQELDFCTMEGLQPVLNIDTNKDGHPDLNLDLDRDGKPELNVDTTGNWIPNINIDSDGDGKADVNLAPNGDGIITDKFADITEWKPKKIVDLGNGTLVYDTMEGIKTKDTLSQLVDDPSGIIVKKPDGGTFLPNYAIRVDVITDTISEEEIQKVENIIDKDSEIKEVFDVTLLKDDTKIQPDGSILVRIPAGDQTLDSILAVQQKDGSYKLVKALFKDGYLEYETDYLGKVSLLKEKEKKTTPPASDPTDSDDTPNTSVQGNYTNSTQTGMGGASTGDAGTAGLWTLLLATAFMFLFALFVSRLQKKE